MNPCTPYAVAAAISLSGGLTACQNPGAAGAEANAVEPAETPTQKVGGDEAAAKPRLENLLRAPLAEREQFEVLISRVQIPPNTTLPRHYHPGQEFLYVVSGSGVVSIDGKDELRLKAGDVGVVPTRANHLARTEDDAVEVIVFRVHDPDKPVRVLVDEEGNELEAKPR